MKPDPKLQACGPLEAFERVHSGLYNRPDTLTTVRYSTGRHYGAPQVLVITYRDPAADPVLVHFDDLVRNICGVVQVLGCELRNIGPAVLREYDHGRYREVSGERAGIYL